MVAFTIFFIAVFAILELTIGSLRAARSLRVREPDTGLVAAMLDVETNKLEEGVINGDFEDVYPGGYPDWHWEVETVPAMTPDGMILTNLWQRDITVYRRSNRGPATSRLRIYDYEFGSYNPLGSRF